MARVLVVGAGFIGRAVAAAVAATGDQPVLASRHPVRTGLAWVPLDVTDPGACATTMSALRPDAVVAVHGPSDVDWCEAHPERARQAHDQAARNVVRSAAGARLLMISTDNVFDGVAEGNDEFAQPRPANAYGAAKLAAEQQLHDHPDATVLRVSLVYGPGPVAEGVRTNFAAACAARLRAGSPVLVPHPQWTTPVHVDDVAAVAAAALHGAPRLLHLGGPERISRLEWAHRLAGRLGAPRDLITAVPKAESTYACRPTNSCLTSRLLPDLLKRWGLRVRGVGSRDPIGED